MGRLKGVATDIIATSAGPVVAALDPPPRTANEKQTAKLAVNILLGLNVGFHRPTRQERDALLVGFAMSRKVLYGAAFDVVRCHESINLSDPSSIAKNIGSLVAY